MGCGTLPPVADARGVSARAGGYYYYNQYYYDYDYDCADDVYH